MPALKTLPPAREAWWQWFGKAFHAELFDGETQAGTCRCCGEQSKQIVAKSGKCLNCWSWATKKVKAGCTLIPGSLKGRVGPNDAQALFMAVDRAVLIGGIAPPPALPKGAEVVSDLHRNAWIADCLLDPPKPPFYLTAIARRCDEVLLAMRPTYSLSRVHIAGAPSVVVDAIAIRETLELLGEDAPATLRTLSKLRPVLARGMSATSAAEKAFEGYRKLADEIPGLTEAFPPMGAWLVEPGFATWTWTVTCANRLARKGDAS